MCSLHTHTQYTPTEYTINDYHTQTTYALHTRTCLYLSLSAGFDLWPETLQEDEVPLPDPDNLRAASLPVWHGRSLEGPSVQSAWYPGRADAPGQARGTLSRTGHLGLRPDSLTEGGLGTGSWRGLGPSKYFAHVVRETQAQGDMVPRDGAQPLNEFCKNFSLFHCLCFTGFEK